MSAWYVFASLGFYPVDPVSVFYEATTPSFNEVLVRFPNGKTLKIKKISGQKSKGYIKKIVLNGKAIKGYRLNHADLIRGGELTYYTF